MDFSLETKGVVDANGYLRFIQKSVACNVCGRLDELENSFWSVLPVCPAG